MQGMGIRAFAALLTLCLGQMASAQDALPPMDEGFSCIEADQAERYVDDFSINERTFGGRELCNAQVDTKKLFNDLTIVEQGRFDGAKQNAFIRGFVNRENYYSWLKSMTYGVRRGHDIPWATAYNSGGYFTMQDGWAKLSTLGRVGTIIHEARHTAGYGHRSCRRGPYSHTAMSGCDDSVGEGGSHGVEMEYYSRVVLQGQNFHPVFKAMARLMNLGRANFVFNDMPMQSGEALLAISGERALLITASENIEAKAPQLEGYQLKRTSFGASLFNGSEAYAVDFHSAEHGSSRISDDYSYYKLLKMPQHVPAIDLEEVDVGQRRFLVSLDDQARLRSFNFPRATWGNPVSVPGARALTTVAPDGSRGLFVIKQDGSLCSLNPDTLNCQSLAKMSWPEEVKSFAVFGDTFLQLNRDGQVIQTEKGLPFEKLNGIRVDKMVSVPVWDSFDL